MMKDICQQSEVIPVAKFDLKGAARPCRMAVRQAELPGVFLGHFQHCRPVHRNDLRIGVALRHRDSVHPMPGRDVQDFARLAIYCAC